MNIQGLSSYVELSKYTAQLNCSTVLDVNCPLTFSRGQLCTSSLLLTVKFSSSSYSFLSRKIQKS
jgi:hypothetical protein